MLNDIQEQAVKWRGDLSKNVFDRLPTKDQIAINAGMSDLLAKIDDLREDVDMFKNPNLESNSSSNTSNVSVAQAARGGLPRWAKEGQQRQQPQQAQQASQSQIPPKDKEEANEEGSSVKTSPRGP